MINNNFIIKQNNSPIEKTGIHAISKDIKAYKDIKDESEKLVTWLNDNNGSFPSPYIMAYAISHCQVVDEPSRMFVVNQELVNTMRIAKTTLRNNINFYFPDQAIFNAEIVEAPEKVEKNVPKRVMELDATGRKMPKIITERGMVTNKLSIKDACMSFHGRTPKSVEIFYRIKVKYQTRGYFGRFKTHTEWVEGLKSHIFQHEIDHSKGINIYHKK